MIVQQNLSVHVNNLPYWQEISDNNLAKFKIINITECETDEFRTVEFTYDINEVKYLFIDLFHAGKKAGIKESFNALNSK